jgi:hypothetical protein
MGHGAGTIAIAAVPVPAEKSKHQPHADLAIAGMMVG